MKCWNIVHSLTDVLSKDERTIATFLKGSMARGEEDEYSDVDYYVLVEKEDIDGMIDSLRKILETLGVPRYIELVFHVAKQLVVIYEDGLHLDVYVTSLDALSQTDQCKVLYDPKGVLLGYTALTLSLDEGMVASIVHGFSFTVHECIVAMKRNNRAFAFRLLSHLVYDLSRLLRFYLDPSFAQLGMKKLESILDSATQKRYYHLLSLIHIDTLTEALKAIAEWMNELVYRLPITYTKQLQLDFFIDAIEQIKIMYNMEDLT